MRGRLTVGHRTLNPGMKVRFLPPQQFFMFVHYQCALLKSGGNKIMKKRFLFALVATVYIVFIVNVISTVASVLHNQEETIFIPITMLSLFVLSAAVMGFLFLSEPLQLFLENKKQEAVIFFGKTVGIFACFVIIFLILVFLI